MAAGLPLATAYVTLALNAKNVAPQARKAFAGVEREADAAGKRGGKKLGSALGKGMAVAASGVAVATTGIVAGIGASINKAMEFDKTMRVVGATLGSDGATQKSLTSLAMKMGKDTVFSAGEASDAMLELAKGGLTAAQIQGGALQATMTLAAAGTLGMGSAATYVGNALNTFGLKAKDASAVAAALAGGANASSASVESLGQALSQVGPGAKTAGLSIQTTTAILAAFDNAGIKGSDAGTSLKTMLTRLVPTTKKARIAMSELGLKFTDATGKFVPMTNVAQQLQDKLGKLSDEQQTTALNTIFGSDATRAATVLMGLGAKGVEKYTKATSDQGAAQRMANTQMEGAAGAWEAFKGSVETIAITIGVKLLPVFTKIVTAANDLAGVVLDRAIPAAQQFFDILFKGDFKGGPLSEDSKVVDVLFRLRDAFVQIKGAASAFFGTLTGGEALAGWEQFSKFSADGMKVRDAFVAIKGAAQSFGEWVKTNLWPALKDAYQTILPGVKDALAIVKGSAGGGGVEGLLSAFKTLGKIITDYVIPTLAFITRNVLPVIAANIRSLIETVKFLGKAFVLFKDVAMGAVKLIVGNFLAFVGIIVNGAAKAFGWIPKLGDKLKGAASEFNKFKANVNASLGGIKDKTVNVGVKFSAGSKITSGGQSFNAGMVGRAGGGVIPGPWRGPTADNVLGVSDAGVPVARVNPREYITRVWATNRMERNNPGALAYINKYGELPRHAGGGLTASVRTPSRRGINEATDSATLDLVARNLKSLTSALGGGPGMGWRAQVAWAKANVPWAAITSTVRSGNPASDHDKGRAIDLAGPNMGRTFDTIKAAFGVSAIRSLYYSPKGNRQVRFNRESNTPPHIFSTHKDHNHWAMNQGGRVPIKPTLYDQGGILKPGTTLVQNNTGRNEYVTPPREKREKSFTPQDYYDAIYDATVDASTGKARRLVASRRAG